MKNCIASQVCGKDDLAAMLAAKRSAGVTPEVARMPLPSVNKAVHSGFETQMRRHQKSKTGESVAPQKGLMSFKKFLKKILTGEGGVIHEI